MAIALAKKADRLCVLIFGCCIIVKRGQIVGKGYHKECGGKHAERIALEMLARKQKRQ
jgi:pyrimidine deaminase RibD-like protein